MIYEKPKLDSKSYIQVDIFSEVSENLNYTILNNDKKVLNTGEIKLDKGFNKFNLLPIADKKLNDKQIKRLGLSSNRADDGNTYFSKGKYIFTLGNTSKEFLVK